MSEVLSAYARQFLEMMQKPDVDQIDGLSPAISIEQRPRRRSRARRSARSPRSTTTCASCLHASASPIAGDGLPIESQTVPQMVDRILALPEGTRLYLLAPIVRGRKGEYRKELADLHKKGFQRIKVDGEFYEIAEVPALDKKFTHDIDVVVDRIVVRPDISQPARGFARTALKLADGLAIAEFADGRAAEGGEANKPRNETAERLVFSENFACPVSGFTIPEIEPRLFSFNNPFGACPKCDGLGAELTSMPTLSFPIPS